VLYGQGRLFVQCVRGLLAFHGGFEIDSCCTWLRCGSRLCSVMGVNLCHVNGRAPCFVRVDDVGE